MADKKIEIRIATTADTAGAKAAEESIKKVAAAGSAVDQSNVRITDTTKANTEAVEANRRALEEWQKSRQKTAGGELALDPVKHLEAEAAAEREVTEAKARQTDALREVARAKEAERVAAQRLREEQRRLTAAKREATAATSNQRRAIFGLNSALSSSVGRMGMVGSVLRGLINPFAMIGKGSGGREGGGGKDSGRNEGGRGCGEKRGGRTLGGGE